jgi:hypothetical protein
VHVCAPGCVGVRGCVLSQLHVFVFVHGDGVFDAL